ncbi:serine protease FAM111A-like isoform X1 [Branchiostoma floridae x Branchiostoma japonicum]
MTLLQFSIDNRKLFACQMLAKAGADLSVCGEDGVTPLHSAAQWRDVSVVRTFVQAGADINATTGLGQTPLDVYRTAVEETQSNYNSAILSLLQDKTEHETRPRTKRIKSEQNQTNDESARSASAKGTIRSFSERLPTELTRLQQLATQLLGPQFNLVPNSEDDEQERIARIQSLIRAEHFSSKVNYSLDSAADDLIHERKRSVCKVEWPGGSGSGFLVGRKRMLTNNHIYEMMEEASKQPDRRSADPRNYRAVFVLSEHQPVVCHIAPKQPLSRDRDLDYAILELVPQEGDNSISDIIPLGQFVSDNLEKDGMVVVVGHPGGGRKKIDFCPISGLDEKYIIHVLFGNPNVPRENAHRAMYHTGVMFHGSSGSAGFDRNGNLVLMHTRGFYPIENQTSLIEEGVRLSSIREHARQNLTAEVFTEIFPQREGGFSFGQQC